MPSKLKQTILRLTDEQRNKMKYIAEKNYRTINDEYKYITDKYIAEYEAQNGEIQLGGGVQRSRRMILENCILKWIPGYAIMAVGKR